MDPNNNHDNDQDVPQERSNFPGNSFAQAITQLGLQAIPTQTYYPPLVHSTSLASAPSATPFAHGNIYPIVPQQQQNPAGELGNPTASAIDASSATSPSQPNVSTSPTAPPPGPRQTLSLSAYYSAIAKKIQTVVLAEWSPRIMTPEQVQAFRLATHQRIDRIRMLEQEQARVGRNVNRHIEHALFIARVDYRTRFSRTFRINDLPNEIFINILRLVCWSALSPAENIRARLYLTWACRHWRTVAIEDHTLWNAIPFTDSPNFERSNAWFERSGNAAIDIRMSDTSANPWTIDVAHRVMTKVFTKLVNIRVLVVVLQDWDPIVFILDVLRTVKEQNIPITMERLEVHRMGPTYIQMGKAHPHEFYSRFIPLFGGAVVPTLNHVTMNAIHIDWTSPCLKNLDTLDVRRVPLERVPDLEQFRKLLSDSSSMHKLVLDGAGPNWAPKTELPAPIELPELRSLALGDFSAAYGTYATAQFNCLKVLDLTLMNVIRDDFTPFWDLMAGRLPALLALTLYGADLFNNSSLARLTFLKWLKSLPKLTFLRVNSVTPVIMDLFLYDTETQTSAQGPLGSSTTAAPTTHPACPELKYLEFHMMDPQYMLRWVTARVQMGLRFQKVYVGELHLNQMPVEVRGRLRSALGGTGSLHSLASASRPPEELDLLKF